MGHFNDFSAADRVTAKGRELIQSAVAWLKDKDAKIIEVDTDGTCFRSAGKCQNRQRREPN